jgi:hypothetical protein
MEWVVFQLNLSNKVIASNNFGKLAEKPHFLLINVPFSNSPKAWRNSTSVLMTMGPYQAIGS